jgi:hypothetical protein
MITARALLALFAASHCAFAAAECRATSGAQTAALVELYTSEGCSSCPPADRWLSGFAGTRRDSRVVPVAFHVQYWDYIGWKDSFGDARYTGRQKDEAKAAGARFVYTPQVIVGGRDFPEWHDAKAFANAVDAIQRKPARATLALESHGAADGSITGSVAVKLEPGVRAKHLVLAALPLQNGLSTRVTAGENKGEQLTNDHVARDLASVKVAKPEARLEFEFKARAGWNAQRMSVAAFVQDTETGEVLQALAAPSCR